jgi:hypothetical protein
MIFYSVLATRNFIIHFYYKISLSHGGEYEDDASGIKRCVVSLKHTDVSEVRTASLMIGDITHL